MTKETMEAIAAEEQVSLSCHSYKPLQNSFIFLSVTYLMLQSQLSSPLPVVSAEVFRKVLVGTERIEEILLKYVAFPFAFIILDKHICIGSATLSG